MDVPLRRSVRCCFGQEDFVGEHTESLRRYIGDKVSSFREKSENCCTDMRVLSQAVPNYLTNEADRARCLKRGGKVEFVHIDLEDAEDLYELEPIEELTPEKVFDARWAMALLGEAMNRLSLEYMTQGKATTFEANGEGSGIRILPRRTAIY
jgi:hypothetical protein